MELHGAAWSRTELHGAAWSCMKLHAAAWSEAIEEKAFELTSKDKISAGK
jgi:hypothetical protein